MAAAGARAQKPVGSSAWIATEKENVAELLEQEMEEAEYPVRHEMDWLNEHMAEIFSKGQTNFTDVFKTPGKMRGKTPRTARKRNMQESRVPLSEIFSSAHKHVENKAISPSPFIHRVVSKTATASRLAALGQDSGNSSQPKYPDLSHNLNSFAKHNTDSGYHGMDDDDELALTDTQPMTQMSTQHIEDDLVEIPSQADLFISQRTTEDSFHSAQENVRVRGETIEPVDTRMTQAQQRSTRSANTGSKDTETEIDTTPKPKSVATSQKKLEKTKGQQIAKEQKEEEIHSDTKSSPQKPPAVQHGKQQDLRSENAEMEEEKEDTVLDDIDDIGSPSDGSTPERPLVRKSSLSFASLPAREPLTKSRISRTSHIDLPKLNRPDRSSILGRQTSGHRTTPAAEEGATHSGAMDVDDAKETDHDVDMDQASKLHNQKSTQSLHDRISMLGKLQPSRPKKSIPMAGLSSGHSGGQIGYPELPASKQEATPDNATHKTRETQAPESMEVDEDDWIKPLSSPPRPNLTKSKTTDVVEQLFDANAESLARKKDPAVKEQHLAEPERPKSSTSIFSSPRLGHQQSASTSNISAAASTTPTGSPRRFDGPLSASKSRLQSIMKTAKGLFTSTGSSSSTGRADHSSPEQTRLQPQEQLNVENDEMDDQQRSSPSRETRRTRGSIEKEEKRRQKELEEREQDEARQERAREQERQRALQLKVAQDKSSVEPEDRAHRQMQSQRQQSREPEAALEGTRHAIPQLKQNDRRPKPTREPVQKPKPQPVSIRVGSTLSRMPMASSVSSGVQESNLPAVASAPTPAPAPAPAAKTATLKKKGSNQSLQTSSSTSSFKSSVSTQAQRKAQLANEKKREQEEREARRKEEQRREQERKRAAQQQQEEGRRQAMRSRAESRVESRAEMEREQRERSVQEDPKKAAHMQAIEKRRLENARRHERQGSQQSINEGPMLQHEKPASQSSQRSDLGATRPPSRLGSAQPYSRAINPPAPNPAKPAKRNMEEEAGQRAPVTIPSNVQPSGEAKRRKTDDEHNPMQPVRPTMAPPIRQSTIRKPSAFGQSGMNHPSGSSIFKTAQPQRPAHPMDMAKYTSGKIPFAEPNHAPLPNAQKPSTSGSAQRPPAPLKPSPQYPNGESIHLPEIATDSEDEDDSDSEMFPVPKWAQPKELEGLLRQQDGMEVDSIFGPIAPFSLEETFKADKKIKKYRDRTSSANWNGPDGLTQEEVRKDIAERQRLKLNGGWSFT